MASTGYLFRLCRTSRLTQIPVRHSSDSSMTAKVQAQPRKRTLPQRAALVLTQAAVNKIKEIMKTQNDIIGLKVGVRQRGCSGLTYCLEYAKEVIKSDEEVSQDGVRIFIDKKAQLSLLGSEMDYVETKLASEFVFNNPNVKGTCGCGESFTV